jgi:HEAT repeat protein
MDGYGHTDIWDSRGHPDSSRANAVRDDWILWMHALRHKEIAPSVEDQKSLAALPSKLKTAKPDELAPLLQEAARVGGEPGGRAILDALAASDPAVRAAAARTAEQTLYGTPVVARLIELLGDPSGEVRTAAVRGLARAANWRYAEAQAALSRQSRTPGLPVDDRVRATEALGDASRLALLGNFEDGLPVWTLVLLLDDETPQVRAAAWAALEKHVPETFGYRPDLPPAEHKAAVEKRKQT